MSIPNAIARQPSLDAAAALEPPPRRVVVKEVNWLGDVVMSLPALKAVRQAYPRAHLAVLIKRELASFFDASTWIDEVIPYTVARGLQGIADRRRIVSEIRARRFDLAVLFPKSFESAFWMTLARVPRRVGFVGDARRAMLTDRAVQVPALHDAHQVHDYLYLLRCTLGIEGDATDGAPDVHAPHQATMRAWLADRRRRQGPLIALAVAAAYGPAKEWPPEQYAALIDLLAERFDAECVLVGAPGERPKCEHIAAKSRRGALVAAGDTTVGEAVGLLSICDGFAGNDSGSMHVGSTLGIPTVAIFGSTDPQRTGPLGLRSRVLRRAMECSPCLQRTCRFGHYLCLTQVAPVEVAQALEELGALSPPAAPAP